MTVADYYRYLSIFKDRLYETIEKEIDITLKKLGIRHLKNQRINTLSLGDKRKVSVGSVNIGNNLIILIDEPFDGIDAGGRRRITKFLKGLVEQKRLILVSTNSVADANNISDW
jgi:ABC-2 type transport system ATP-binding protein